MMVSRRPPWCDGRRSNLGGSENHPSLGFIRPYAPGYHVTSTRFREGISRPPRSAQERREGSIMEPRDPHESPFPQGLKIDLLRQAVEIYLSLAYPSRRPPVAVLRRLEWPPD